MKVISYHFTKTSFWVRILGIGISVSKEPMLFSMRNGYKKYLKLPFGWRISYLPKPKKITHVVSINSLEISIPSRTKTRLIKESVDKAFNNMNYNPKEFRK